MSMSWMRNRLHKYLCTTWKIFALAKISIRVEEGVLIERRWCRAPAWISHLTCCAWTWHKSLCQMPAQDIGCTSKDKAPLGILNCKGNARRAEGEREGVRRAAAILVLCLACARHFWLCVKESFKPPRRQHVRAACNSSSSPTPFCPAPFHWGTQKKRRPVSLPLTSIGFKPEHKSSARFTLHKMPKPLSMPMEMEMELEMCEWRCEDSIVKCRHCWLVGCSVAFIERIIDGNDKTTLKDLRGQL